MSPICDCEHHSHEPSAKQAATGHEYGAAESVAAIKSPWGGTFRRCQACLDAGHMQGTQVR